MALKDLTHVVVVRTRANWLRERAEYDLYGPYTHHRAIEVSADLSLALADLPAGLTEVRVRPLKPEPVVRPRQPAGARGAHL